MRCTRVLVATLPLLLGLGGCELLYPVTDRFTRGTPDASPPADAARESESDSAPMPSCAAFVGAAFCDDFESKTLPVERWTGEGVSAGGSLTLRSEGLGSSVRAALVGSGVVETAYLFKDLAVAPRSRVRLGFRMRADQYPSAVVQLGGIQLTDSGTDWSFFLQVGDGIITAVAQRSAPYDGEWHPFSTSPLAGAWMRVELEISWSELPPRLSVKIDGQLVTSKPSALDIPRIAPRIVVGAAWTQTAPAFVTDVDDVLVEIE